MEALILVGGLGTRLRPLIGASLPKPMVEIDGRPFLEYLVRQLHAGGCSDVWMLLGHGAEVIRQHFADGSAWGCRIRYSQEPAPLGTGGAVRYALEELDGDRFVVLNGDSFVDVAIPQLLAAHAASTEDGVAATLVLVRQPDAGRFGRVELDAAERVRAFREKDPADGPGLINAGVYVVERAVIEGIPNGRPVSLERDVWPHYTDGRLAGLVTDGAFTDIGVPETLAAVRSDPAGLLRVAGLDR